MKSLNFFFFAIVGFTTVYTHPHQGWQQSKCRLLEIRERNKSPYVGQDGLPREDSLRHRRLKNVLTTRNKESIRGTFALKNMVRGTTSSLEDFNYDPIHQIVYLNITIKHFTFTGLYEVIDGQLNTPKLGRHHFSGKGIVNASAFDVVISAAISPNSDPKSQLLSINELQMDYDFGKVSIFAENFVVNGIPVDWKTINQNSRPLLKNIWEAVYNYIFKVPRSSVAKYIEGCKLSDIHTPTTSLDYQEDCIHCLTFY